MSITKSAKETQKIGESFAKEILSKKIGKAAVVLGLEGDLGAGKTTFLQGFAKGLGIKEVVNSPTFIIMKKFQIPAPSPFFYFYHIDCYRLGDPEEIISLNFKEIVKNPENIIAIEWPEKIKSLMPKHSLSLSFLHLKGTEREITIDKK